MLRVGIIGFGFMGKAHFAIYNRLQDAKVVAICDTKKGIFEETAGIAGNIAAAEGAVDLTGIACYTDFDRMLKEASLDAISITLPTYLHAEYTVKAFKAGVNVLCEKPMALKVEDCDTMVAAAKESKKILQVGHCIRFWPAYTKTKEIIDSGKYGKVRAANFQRFSMTPTWTWDNWMMDGTRSGGANIDLHIHDADFIQYAFGMPKAVSSRGLIGPANEVDHLITQYIYDDDRVISAEGGWIMTDSFKFRMSFMIILEKANIQYDCTRDPAFTIFPAEGDPITPDLDPGDGYYHEIVHFVKKLKGESVPEILTPQQSKDSIRLVLAERQSVNTGKEISIA